MELEEMKNLWGEMSARVEEQKKLTDVLIIKMIKTDYRSKLNNILIPELAGTFICFAAAIFIAAGFYKLDTWYLAVCGAIGVLILLLTPILSLSSISKLRSINISANTYQQSLIAYSKHKLQFIRIQKLNFLFASVLLVVILPVISKLIIGGVDPFKAMKLWYIYALVFPFSYGFARWTFKKYIKYTVDAENILKELEA